MSTQTEEWAKEMSGTILPKVEEMLKRGVPLSEIGAIMLGMAMGMAVEGGVKRENVIQLIDHCYKAAGMPAG